MMSEIACFRQLREDRIGRGFRCPWLSEEIKEK